MFRALTSTYNTFGMNCEPGLITRHQYFSMNLGAEWGQTPAARVQHLVESLEPE